MYAAAKNGHVPDVLGMVHVNEFTPIPAVSIIVSLQMLYFCILWFFFRFWE